MAIYLDHNATTPVDPAAADAVDQAMRDDFGNASSVHAWGQRAKARLDRARVLHVNEGPEGPTRRVHYFVDPIRFWAEPAGPVASAAIRLPT